MSDPIQSLFEAGVISTTLYAPNSRYHTTPTARLTSPDGRELVYLQRRFIPPASAFAVMFEHTVVQADRGDLLAARYLGDPQLAWRLFDANVVLDPVELTERAGMRIRITLPAGVPAPANE